MRDRDEQGRRIDPFAIFEARAHRALKDMRLFEAARDPRARVRCLRADVSTQLPRLGSVDAIITSPPYHSAVDYYRRHQLEQFWLGFVRNQPDRLALLDGYLGRPKVPARHRFIRQDYELGAWATELESAIAAQDRERSRAFRHYCVGMRRSLHRLSNTLRPGGRAIFVVGHSKWRSTVIDTSRLLSELAGDRLELVERRWYPVANRYMSYERRNGASIDEEYVLVYERPAGPLGT